MRLYTVLDTIIKKINPMTLSEAQDGSVTTQRTIAPNVLNTAIRNIASSIFNVTPSTPTINISASTGTLDGVTVKQFGKVVQLTVSISNSASVASGGNIFVGTIETTGLRPILTTTGGTYYSSFALAGTISTTGVITIRNSDSRSFGSTGSNHINISFTYLVA